MRVRVRTVLKPGCVVCKRSTCKDDKLQICSNMNSVRITRHMKKVIENLNEFIIVENYRCMPLLGDEENVPNWDVHIVKYTIVYVNKNMEERTFYTQYF